MPGNHPSQTEKTRIRTVAETNSGIVMAKIAKVETAKSTGRSRHRPVTTPRKIAIGTPSASEHAASSNELPNRSPTSSAMLFSPLAEIPRSPRAALVAQSKYRSAAGRFKPCTSRQFSRSLPWASRSRNAVQLSPGSISTPAKMIIETIQTVTSPRNNRRSSIASMGQDPFVGETKGVGISARPPPVQQ